MATLVPLCCRNAQRRSAFSVDPTTTVVIERNAIKSSYIGVIMYSLGDAEFGGRTTWTVKIREYGDFGATLQLFCTSQNRTFHSSQYYCSHRSRCRKIILHRLCSVLERGRHIWRQDKFERTFNPHFSKL